LGEILVVHPVISFDVEFLNFQNVTFTVWDSGGHGSCLLPLMLHYFPTTQGLILVVDSNDCERIDDAIIELDKVAMEGQLRDACLLVLANKQDAPNAMTVPEITERLGLHQLRRRAWHIRGTCATSGDGLLEGLDWLIHAIKFGKK
jgi:ADP-ribosylation factor protein 1